jgi:hypothetical protein
MEMPKRLDSDNTINLSSLIVSLASLQSERLVFQKVRSTDVCIFQRQNGVILEHETLVRQHKTFVIQ